MLGSSYTSTYKIIKTGWGIWIQIRAKANFRPIDDTAHAALLTLNILPKSFDSPLFHKYLLAGLHWVEEEIRASTNHPINVVVEELLFNPCDFQDEGLFYAMADWASDYFGFELPAYSYSYNEKINRYEFPDLKLP